ncbi:silent chromatin protein ESC1-like isoform X3 [Glossina fuscipes]|uniref:Silent chromatin protein ESC1-like isoform X3 n=1 Tax=Glossina fuscipes TaxID=7396 RepID=A0A9C6DTH9_9MUSC|nr:silent chromatin protein ESC1-like isoform X3 [Glossina fuscipes]
MPPKRRRRFQGIYYHSSPPKVFSMNGQISNGHDRKRKREVDDFSVKLSTIRIWMHEKDIGKLTRILWAGQGNRLRQQASTNSKVKRFLSAVPYVMNSVKDVHQAVIDNSLENLQTHLEPPVPPALVTCRDANGLNLIHKAAGLGHATILEYLIATWPDGVHEIDITGKTPLHWAASAKNNMRCYTLLTQAGCDEEVLDYRMKTPTYYRHKPNEIERAFLTYVPEAPRVSPGIATDWEALSDDSGDGKKRDIKIPELNGFGRHSITESNENTSEAEVTEGLEQISEDNRSDNPNEEKESAENANDSKAEEQSTNGNAEDQEASSEEVENTAKETKDPEEDNEEDKEKEQQSEETNNNNNNSDDRENGKELIENNESTDKETELNDHHSNQDDEQMTNGNGEDNVAEEEAAEEKAVEEEADAENATEEEAAAEKAAVDEVAEEEVVEYGDNEKSLQRSTLESAERDAAVTPSLAIEGFVAGASEDNTVQSQTAAIDHNEKELQLQQIVAAGDMEKLAEIVLNGDGEKLSNLEATEPEVQAFLNNVPNYMNKIQRVHKAARNGSLLSLQQALDRRKFAISRDNISPNGATPLHVATLFGHSDILRYLASRFPETTSATDFDERTPLHYAAVINDNGHFYNLLLKLGANPKIEDKVK